MSALSKTDPTSYSNPTECLVEHIHLDLKINFDRHTLSGSAVLSIKKINPETDLILDTRDLTIFSIKNNESKEPLEYTLNEPDGCFGSKLTIQLPELEFFSMEVLIEYETKENCTALQWLPARLTKGKRHPYLYSQCQAIHCRSIIPLQDTPCVKCPFTAKVTAPSDLKVLMSALHEDINEVEGDPAWSEFNFRQKIPMPSCLMSIVCGDITYRDVGPRTRVWAEPELVEQAAWEFAETENMLQVAEELMGPYVWGQYDLVVLPPSFPFGGMENPCITFVTPTLIAGDRSLADVVAHEIAHSWTGNLVTNKNPNHFWLNEGNTMFFERKIDGVLRGGEKLRQFKSLTGWNELQTAVDSLGADNPYTRLVLDMKGVDPDDAFSSIPYEKGHALLFYLEQLLGGPEVFEPFLREYIKHFRFQSITTADWKEFLLEYFANEVKEGKLDEVDWDAWLYGLGMPPVKPHYDQSLGEDVDHLIKRWLECTNDEVDSFYTVDIVDFVPVQMMHFLDELRKKERLSQVKVQKMGEVYLLNSVKNFEVRWRWIRLAIYCQYKEIVEMALEFVAKIGRLHFIAPLYKDLYNWEFSRDRALKTFQETRDNMHYISVLSVERELELDSK
ncbi:leukotriene A-4 hydrolase-like [Dreissena polymorpha]|uniref:leukotriene A-4 hydrolase-like n=1 Tax=Dreissena polymorpha TaxID=45954 RepID=UPI00226449EE|nr:leukotriene A-4 hydrolase-like [Dreissena polymorpha]XP_052231553.1 leukotriene A-4 hydrolase-like [Dreissena polymorpha]XP_052231555.1 leukotriene A-4 hydrolase-like [Dreissena polymorpha]